MLIQTEFLSFQAKKTFSFWGFFLISQPHFLLWKEKEKYKITIVSILFSDLWLTLTVVVRTDGLRYMDKRSCLRMVL